MISGQQTLGSIDASMQELRDKISQGAQQIEERSSRLLVLQQEEVAKYRELGRLRVEMLAADKQVIADDADRTVQELLEQRRQGLQRVHDDLASIKQRRLDLEQQRQQQAKVVEDATEVVDAAEEKTQDRLNADPAYQKQLQVTREVERMVKHARAKAEQREEERASKGRPYQDDPLFMYLWNRKYGTVEYRANGLTRWLDSWVAKLVRYSLARVNYSKLQEIPQRLREHADQVEEHAGQEFETLKTLDTRAREEDGIPALEKILEQKEEELAAIDGQIEKTVTDQQALEKLLSEYSAGQDEYYRKAVDYLAAELRRDDLQDLRRQAYATPYPEDDMVIGHLVELEAEERDLHDSVTELKKGNSSLQERLTDLESVRSRFKRSRFDSAGMGFSDPAVIYTMLGNLINGAINSDAFWRILQQQKRYQPRRANPGFGSGGFGRGTVWGGGMRFPGSGRGGGIFGSGGRGGFRFPRSGGGGGFRTGGGF